MTASSTVVWMLAASFAAAPALGAEPCTFKWDASHEVAVFRTEAAKLAVGGAADQAPAIRSEQLYELDLQPQEQVHYTAPPSKKMLADGASGGVLALRVAQPGLYRIAVDSGFWLDVVDHGKPLDSVDFNGSQDCPGPRKIVVYNLPANTDLLVQISAALKPRAKLSVTRVADGGK